MRKCRLCGRVVEEERTLPVCSECSDKIEHFVERQAAAAAVVGGTIAACILTLKRGRSTGSIDEGRKKLKKMGASIANESMEAKNLAASVIEEKSMLLKDIVGLGLDAAECKLKGLPAAYAKEEHPMLAKKLGRIFGKREE